MIPSISLKFRQYLEAFAKQYYYFRTLKGGRWGGREGERERERERDALDLIHKGNIVARLRLNSLVWLLRLKGDLKYNLLSNQDRK